MPFSRVRFVLLRPQYAGNLGAAARALKNFGQADWVWVNPGAEIENADGEARKMAVQSEDILRLARRVATLEEAIADCTWVVGTSSRKLKGRRSLPPRAFARELATRSANEQCALIFGDERSGLTNDELDRCHDLSSVRTAPEQPSLNLAQAILLYAYEVHEALLETQPAPAAAPSPVPAPAALFQRLEHTLRTGLRDRGFLSPDGRGGDRHAVRDLVLTLQRARLSQKEAQLWMAALSVLGRP